MLPRKAQHLGPRYDVARKKRVPPIFLEYFRSSPASKAICGITLPASSHAARLRTTATAAAGVAATTGARDTT